MMRFPLPFPRNLTFDPAGVFFFRRDLAIAVYANPTDCAYAVIDLSGPSPRLAGWRLFNLPPSGIWTVWVQTDEAERFFILDREDRKETIREILPDRLQRIREVRLPGLTLKNWGHSVALVSPVASITCEHSHLQVIASGAIPELVLPIRYGDESSGWRWGQWPPEAPRPQTVEVGVGRPRIAPGLVAVEGKHRVRIDRWGGWSTVPSGNIRLVDLFPDGSGALLVRREKTGWVWERWRSYPEGLSRESSAPARFPPENGPETWGKALRLSPDLRWVIVPLARDVMILEVEND